MRVLVLCDDVWHPARVPRTGLGALPPHEFEFDWIEHAADWSAERMAAYPAVLLTKSNHTSSADKTEWMTGDVQTAFADYVRGGNGLLAVHSGTAGYQHTPILRALLGGVFIQHPAQCPVTVKPSATHPLSMGSAPFTLVDEHYFMALDDSQADVFAITTSEHGEQPGAWRRSEGAGRVAVLTPGHNQDVWLHPSFQTLLLNALRWCAKP